MTYLLATIISLFISGYVVYPLFQKRYQLTPLMFFENAGNLNDLESAKEEALRAIKEIDFEYQLGKMTREDYESLKAEYQRRAVLILKQIDDRQQRNMEGDPLEERIRLYRQQLKRTGGIQNNQRLCPQCGQMVQKDYQFCVYCGEKLNV